MPFGIGGDVDRMDLVPHYDERALGIGSRNADQFRRIWVRQRETNRIPFTRLKMAVLALIPKASVITATVVKPGLLQQLAQRKTKIL